MAEIRRHDEATGDPIAQAIRAALGEPVQPIQPGSTPTRVSPKHPTTTWSWTTPPIVLTPVEEKTAE